MSFFTETYTEFQPTYKVATRLVWTGWCQAEAANHKRRYWKSSTKAIF